MAKPSFLNFVASAISFQEKQSNTCVNQNIYRGVNNTKRFWAILLSFLVIWAALTVLAVTWETRFDWPDNVHIDYGVPLVWATQTLSTLVGPVDLWTVDIAALMTNLAFWLGIMIAAAAVMLYFNQKDAKREKT